MGFWDTYRASLKSPEVEEPIDYWLHRPLGYVVARLSYPLPVSPDALTVGSILLGWAAGACLALDFDHHMLAGAGLLLASTTFDCADGQLARMRGTSSVFGRMLDGTADTLVLLSVVPVTVYRVWTRHHDPSWLGWAVIGLAVLTVFTSSFHTVVYDYYKNVWLRFTSDGYKEGESYAPVRARYEEQKSGLGLVRRAAFLMYLAHVGGQEDFIKKFDPHISLDRLPPRTPENEAIYRQYQTKPWTLNRWLFGTGSLMFGLELFSAVDQAEVFLLLRLVVLNGLFYLALRPMQRHASQAAFAAMAARGA